MPAERAPIYTDAVYGMGVKILLTPFACCEDPDPAPGARDRGATLASECNRDGAQSVRQPDQTARLPARERKWAIFSWPPCLT